MFEIIPGRGVTLVYPRTSRQVWASDMHYADLTLQPGRMYYYTDPFGLARFQPRYYYAIASTAPLDLRRLHASLGATRRMLGRMYGSFRPYDVIDRLTELVVPMQSDEDWATDLFIDWPGVPSVPRSVLAYQFVRCANGRVLFVGVNYPYYGCPGDTQLSVATAEKPAVKELPFEAIPRPPRGEKREPIELTAPDVGNRRRAEAGAPPPRRDPMSRGHGREGIRYSDDGFVPPRRGEPPASPDPQRPSSEGSQRVEASEPRLQPAPDRSEPRVQEPPVRGGERERKP
jgi:hypothetical protein